MILLESMGKTFKAWNPELPDNTEMQTDWRWVNTRMDNDFDVEVLPREAMQHDNGKLKLDKNRRRLQGEEGIWNLDSDSEGKKLYRVQRAPIIPQGEAGYASLLTYLAAEGITASATLPTK